MYVGLPKNYGGTAFQREKAQPPHPSVPPVLPHAVPPPKEKMPPKREQCENCASQDKNPLSCILSAFRRQRSSGIEADDLLLVGLIALLMGKEGNEDIIFILAMLLMM